MKDIGTECRLRVAAVPGAVISGILFAACLGLYQFVDRIDSEIRRG